MDPTERARLAEAQAQAVLAQMGGGWWSLLLDPVFTMTLVVGLTVLYMWRLGIFAGGGYLSKQLAYLDHARASNDKALEQTKSFEEMIQRQYHESNARSDKALAQSDEAIRLNRATLSELQSLNRSLARLTEIMAERNRGP